MSLRLTEQQLLDRIIDLATRTRWAVHHDRPARRAGNRWHTARCNCRKATT